MLQVLYTQQKTKKAKTWHDGILKMSSESKKVPVTCFYLFISLHFVPSSAAPTFPVPKPHTSGTELKDDAIFPVYGNNSILVITPSCTSG